jgi:hypothetical protein
MNDDIRRVIAQRVKKLDGQILALQKKLEVLQSLRRSLSGEEFDKLGVQVREVVRRGSGTYRMVLDKDVEGRIVEYIRANGPAKYYKLAGDLDLSVAVVGKTVRLSQVLYRRGEFVDVREEETDGCADE